MRKIKQLLFPKLKSEKADIDLEILKERLNKSGLTTSLVIFDVGAHRGNFSLKLLTSFPLSKIYAFEPVSTSFESLKEVSLKFSEISCFQYAIGDKASTSIINLNRFDETNSLFRASKTDSYIDDLTTTLSTEEVIIKTLDEICNELYVKEIDLLKIDVQGFELNVLKGAKNLLENKSIKFIYCEIEFIELYEGQPLIEDMITYLRACDYLPAGIYNINYTNDGNIGWCDILFKKN